MTKCKFNLREQNRSVYCTKLEQWVSIKYCALCQKYEPSNVIHEAGSPKLKCNKHAMLFHNYNYNIASCNKRGFWGLSFFIKEISSLVSWILHLFNKLGVQFWV
jgi:hypothetical protein